MCGLTLFETFGMAQVIAGRGPKLSDFAFDLAGSRHSHKSAGELPDATPVPYDAWLRVSGFGLQVPHRSPSAEEQRGWPSFERDLAAGPNVHSRFVKGVHAPSGISS